MQVGPGSLFVLSGAWRLIGLNYGAEPLADKPNRLLINCFSAILCGLVTVTSHLLPAISLQFGQGASFFSMLEYLAE
jgi:hypothetical protein